MSRRRDLWRKVEVDYRLGRGISKRRALAEDLFGLAALLIAIVELVVFANATNGDPIGAIRTLFGGAS